MNNLQSDKNNIENKLSFFMRLLGALIVISAAIGFAIKDWNQLLSWQKCSLLFISNIFIAITAWCSKFFFKDQKGQGALFAVAVSMIPIHFAQLGGFIMNSFGFEEAKYKYIDMVHWQADSGFTSIALVVVGIAIFVPIARTAFGALLNNNNVSSTVNLYLLTNSILLLPFRSAWFVLPVVTALLIILIFNDRKYLASKKDIGSIIVRVIMFLAPIIMAARMYYIYDHTAITIGVSLLIFAMSFFVAANYLHEDTNVILTIQVFSIVNSLIGWLIIAVDIIKRYNFHHELLIIGIPMSILLILGGIFAKKRIESCFSTAIFIALMAQTFELCFYNNIFSATFVTLLSVLILCYCYVNRDYTYTFFTFLLLIAGICINYSIAMKEDSYFPWFIIGFAGVSIILLASLPEKFKKFIKREGANINANNETFDDIKVNNNNKD